MARKRLVTRVVFQLHLWGGLALGLYACLIGVTGSVLVFRDEIVHRLSPVPTVEAPVGTPDLDTIRAGIQAHYPDSFPWSLESPAAPSEPWGSYLLRPGGGRMVYADGNGRVVGELRLDGTWFRLVEQFHSHLLLPKGRLVNGIAGLALAALAVTGLFLWWPASGEWPAAFRIVRRSNWKGIVFDLHRVGGTLLFALLLLSCVTGAYFTWPAVYRNIVASVLPMQPKPPAPPVEEEGSRLSLDAMVRAAQRAIPDTALVRVLVPRSPTQPVTVVLAHGPSRQLATSELTVHPYTGAVLAIDDYRQRHVGNRLVTWLGPLHTGHFGGLGVKLLWAAVGMAFPALFVTGFVMWCNRVLAPRVRRARHRD